MKDTGVIEIHGRAYKTVALRVSEFRAEHGIGTGWGIHTDIVEATDSRVVMRAEVRDPEGRLVASGYAEESRTSSQINRTSALENCETSAIGRALAAAGWAGSEYASANEVKQAIHQQTEGERDTATLRELMGERIGVKSKTQAEALIRFVTDGGMGHADLPKEPGEILECVRVAWEAAGHSYEGMMDAATEWWNNQTGDAA